MAKVPSENCFPNRLKRRAMFYEGTNASTDVHILDVKYGLCINLATKRQYVKVKNRII